MVLVGMFQTAWISGESQLLIIAVLAVTGVVLGAWYMLWLSHWRRLAPQPGR